MTPNQDFKIRKAIPDDISFIYATFLRSFKHDSSLGRSLRSSTFFNYYRQVVDYILGLPSTEVSLVCLPQDEKVILGYMVHENNIIHYIFVKDSFRKLGLAKALVNSANFTNPIIYTHLTTNIIPLLKKFYNLEYNPLLLYLRES